MFNFEKLDVWQEAIDFAILIYEVTAKFPEQERFGLKQSSASCRCIHIVEHSRRQFTFIPSRLCAIRRDRDELSI